jgi:hypothetical protein
VLLVGPFVSRFYLRDALLHTKSVPQGRCKTTDTRTWCGG